MLGRRRKRLSLTAVHILGSSLWAGSALGGEYNPLLLSEDIFKVFFVTLAD